MNKENKKFSSEHLKFLKNQKRDKHLVHVFQIGLLVFMILAWEISAKFKLIDAFLVSSPSRIFSTILELNSTGMLWENIISTVVETVLGFVLGTFLGIVIAIIIWWSPLTCKILNPYLVVLNALPKVALGPIIIVWIGANSASIIIMALLVSVIISVINILSSFQNTSEEKILLFKSFGANKLQILTKLVLPSNFSTIISTLKINVGMSLIGVIAGEFLVSNKGIGYLIVYGGQVFRLDLVMTGIIILSIIASIMYVIVAKIESSFLKKFE